MISNLFSTPRRLPKLITITALLFMNADANAQSKNIPPASSYVPTEIQGVYGGVTYGLSIQQKSSEVYVAAETMRGGFFGAAHDPNNGTWKSENNGKSWR